MYRTFKISVFDIVAAGGKEFAAVNIIDGRLVVNNECCDLRPLRQRYNPETKELAPSVIDSILCAESMLTMHYGKVIGAGDYSDKSSNREAVQDSEVPAAYNNTLYDFITVDCSGGNDSDDYVKVIKDLLCFDGLYLPLSKLEAVGYIPHSYAEVADIAGVKYIRYRAAMQSASENRQCKMTMTTYPWAGFARTISGDALYLSKPTQTAQKAIARQGLGKSNGNIVEDFKFSFAIVPDLKTDITFAARCFDDAKNEITNDIITVKKTATDGCGFITPGKASELAGRLGLNYMPSAFQIRYGQVKGILLVFDFHKYTGGVVKEDILFTESMWKSNFDVEKAEFLVANVSKPPRSYSEWNYQMFTTLNNCLSFEDIRPYLEDIRAHMEKALSSPEAALKFLGILSDISDMDNDEGNEYSCVDKVSAVISANPQLAMNIKWVKQSIKRKIDLVSKKMLFGKIPMPQSSISIMAPDPLAFFNRLRRSYDGGYGFAEGELIVPMHKKAKELAAREFGYGGYKGELLAARNPLTHYAQNRKLNCVSHKGSEYWYRHLNQVLIFNAHDETVLGMGGADHDGDSCINTKLFTDKFTQADYIIYNANDTGDKQAKVVLTEEVMQKGIRANLQQNMLGVICNINTRALELMNDPAALRKFVMLAGYTGDRSFGAEDIPQMPYYPKFKDTDTAKTYLERLNHILTTLSELEVDRPKTGYINRFVANQQEYTLPFAPYWFANIKGQLDSYENRPTESFKQNRFKEPVRILSKSYNDGKIVKVIYDTLKENRKTRENWIQRTIEMLNDGDTVMANIQRFVQEEILDMEIDTDSCFSIIESLKNASALDMDEAARVMEDVRTAYKNYCRDIAGNIKAMKNGSISKDDFDNALENIINQSDERLRSISTDRAALAYAAYTLSLENGYGSQSFPFLVTLDGMAALLNDVRTTDFYEINIRRTIPRGLAQMLDNAAHLIVYNRQFRLPEYADPSKTYFGDVNLPNGSYELHRDIKGGVFVIVPKPAPKNKLNMIPVNDRAEFSLKVSYKASELLSPNQNGEYITRLMAEGVITFREATINRNIQYCVYADDIWVGSIFDDQANNWVLKKEVVRQLLGKEYALVGIPRTGVKTNSNSFTTGSGKARTAQVLTFVQAKPVEERVTDVMPVHTAAEAVAV